MGGPGGEGGFGGGFSGAVSNSDVDLFETMTHSSADAYANPVLHITEAGTYVLSGTWHGQIWVEAGKNNVELVLNGVEVSCDVAPALVFKKVYECGHADTFADLDDADDDDGIAAEIKAMMASDSSDVSAYVLENAGAVVTISDGTTNNFTGANVYRILLPKAKNSSVTAINGKDISAQKKLYKMDGAFYSHRSMVIQGGTNGTGTLNITSTTYEGLDSEMHMNIEGGIISVTAEDDGINVNEDNISVFTMNGGSLTVKAPNADGIDSNGYIVITSADVLSITAKDASKPENKANLNSGADGALDADCGVYMSDEVFEIYTANSDGTDAHGGDGAPRDGDPRDGEGGPGGLRGN